MTRKAHGILRQNTVILDAAIPELEGHRVEVELRDAVTPEESAPPESELRAAWTDWANGQEQGPITGEPESWP